MQLAAAAEVLRRALMQRKLIVSLVSILAILGVSLGLAVWLVRTAPEAPQVEISNPPLLVKAVRVEPRDVVEPLVGYGTARAERYARLSAQVAGEVEAARRDWGDGTGFMFAPGCEMPFKTPIDNIIALREAVARTGEL